MRKQILSVALLVAIAATAAAQTTGASKLDLRGRMQLAVPKLTSKPLVPGGVLPKQLTNARRVADLAADEQVAAFITLNDGYTRADLEEQGVAVRTSRGGILVATMPKGDALRISTLDCVRSMHLERPVQAKMDLARPASGVDFVQSGLDLPQAYTGRGVVAGIVDGGFDPNHINFRGSDGLSRIRYLVVNSANSANKISSDWYTDDPSGPTWTSDHFAGTLAEFTTDNTETTHGTHTLGIMAGNYRGPVTAATSSTAFATTVEDLEQNPWYGVASGATLMAAAGTGSDALIAEGIDRIVSYSDALGYPTVINLSLGTNIGPHDGSSPLSTYMDLIAEEEGFNPVTICLASGNEGTYPIALNKEFTEEETTVKTGLYPFLTADKGFYDYGYYFYRNGEIEIYGDDESPIDISVVVFNTKRPSAISYTASMPLLGSEAGEEGAYKCYVSDSEVQESVGGTIVENFGKYYQGMVYVANGYNIDETTGKKRFMGYVFINAMKRLNSTQTGYVDEEDQYAMGLIITGASGNKVAIYSDAATMTFDDYDRTGWVNGTTDGSISDMATGKKVITVGSYNTRNIYGGLDGGAPFNDSATFPLGEVSSFTSYGTLADGRTLPHVCAPGTYLVSSASPYYVENEDNYVTEGEIQGIFTEGATDADGVTTVTRRNYWQAMCGTSMACPYVAGSIALWLEADPTLTPTEIQEIIAATAVSDDDVAKGNPVQWGAGKFDAYAGLKEVLRRKATDTGIVAVADDSPRPVITPDGRRAFRVFLAGATSVRATLYDATGRTAGSYRADGDELRVDATPMPAGVYILLVDGYPKGERIIIK